MTAAAARRRRRVVVGAVALAVATPILATLAVVLGAADLSFGDVWATIGARLGLGEPVLSTIEDGIVWQRRVPRVLVAIAVGAGLAVCGAVMQSVTRNPLADPYLLGLSSGASLGAVCALLLGIAIPLPVAAFGGAALALAMTVGLATAIGQVTPTRTVLAGLAVSSMLGAVTSLVIFWVVTGDSYREILGWLMGTLAAARWEAVWLTWAGLVAIVVPIVLVARRLDAFAFGDRHAASLGIHPGRTRLLLLGATALLTGILVSVSGSIGFVGLIVPHAVRLLTGPGHRALLPLSALAGGLVLLAADTIARTAFEPRELPVGIVTALVGAPAFAAILLRQRRSA
ncbi:MULTISPECIES: putative F420-0 ABC transporter permease subunit [unclassified Agrococcus]|uniref:putative F420-0 ABC transporter permease subunit n=1 Tax=unclassified Agrococcus TaxID=2615065 RepID=UPI00361EB381